MGDRIAGVPYRECQIGRVSLSLHQRVHTPALYLHRHKRQWIL
ncbi:hypothetical protein [Methanosarcina horonobensis]|nr:hypothetical protein [Methanosarcina horonobensis]